MQLRFISSILIFISAYSPLSLIFLVQDYDFDKHILCHPKIVYPVLVISVISCMIVIASVEKIKFSSPPIEILSVSNRSGELINYSIPYMISFFAVDLGDINQLICFGIFMVLMYWLTLKTHNMFINPVLALRGYNLYDVRYKNGDEELQDFFLSKDKRLENGDKCRIVEVSENLYLVTEINPEI